ncbi:MAG: phosphotransferase enzyme family protein [Myxococcota bacterium]
MSDGDPRPPGPQTFRDLTGDEQSRRIADLARRALHRWGLQDAGLSLLKYRENAVFAVTGEDGERFALRVHRPGYRTDAHIRSEVQWMQALASAGVRTPEVVPTLDGEVVATAGAQGVPEPRQCDLFRWVDGEQLGRLEDGVQGDAAAVAEVYRVIGRLAAVVHDHGAAWKKPEGFSRPAWDADALVGDDPTFGRFWELDCLEDAQRTRLLETRDRVRTQLALLGKGDDRYGLLHGDFLPENVLVADGEPRLIDFDDCGDGWYAFELATGLFPLVVQGNAAGPGRAYVEGYREVRALAEEPLELLPTLLMARALSYLGWPVGRPEMAEARQLAPAIAAIVTGLAERYLAGEPLGLVD